MRVKGDSDMSTTNSAGGTLSDPVVTVLDALSAQGWRMLHTTRWPGHPGESIEHVAIGPGGVVVVAAPHRDVHDEALDTPMEDLACATAAVTALVAPRHRRAVSGVLAIPSGTEALTCAHVVESDHLAGWLTGLDPVLSPLEVVLVSAYLRDRLNPASAPRATQVPTPAPPADDAAPAPAPEQPDEPPEPVARRRRRWWPLSPGTTTAVAVAAGVTAPWLVASLLHVF